MAKHKLAEVNPEDLTDARLLDAKSRPSVYEFDDTDEESMRNRGGWTLHFTGEQRQKLSGPDEVNNLYTYQDDRTPPPPYNTFTDAFELRPANAHERGAVCHHVRTFTPVSINDTLTGKLSELQGYYRDAQAQGFWANVASGRKAMRSDQDAFLVYILAFIQGTFLAGNNVEWRNGLPGITEVSDSDVFNELFTWQVADYKSIAGSGFVHLLTNRGNWATHHAELYRLHGEGDQQGLAEYDCSTGWTQAPTQGQGQRR